MKGIKIYMFMFTAIVFLAAAFGDLSGQSPSPNANSAGPEWPDEWEKVLVEWIKSLSIEDVTITEKPFDFSKFDAAEFRKNQIALASWAPPLRIAVEALRLPPEGFVWSGIWRPELPVSQRLNVASGQMWLPTHPTVAYNLAWLYSWNRQWNPYFENPAVARRAAVVASVNLIMQWGQIRYVGRPHTGQDGYLLTFNAYIASTVGPGLPANVRKALGEGLKAVVKSLVEVPVNGPENMMLAMPVGIYYAALATGDDSLKKLAEERMGYLLDKFFDRTGYFRDQMLPDGSYNGISMHRLAEYYAISQSPRVLDVLRRAYRLKSYLTLPEPDGTTLSPSHFNARCQDGFDNDQYTGREIMFLSSVPDAAFFLRLSWEPNITPESVRKLAEARIVESFISRIPAAAAWGYMNPTEHSWGLVLNLPYVLFNEQDSEAVDAMVREAKVPIQTSDRYTENFSNQFYVIRRPAYTAIFYTGPSCITSDDGGTNFAQMLGYEGGTFNGFAGGGVSAFWTPEAGSTVIGRLTARESYQRKVKIAEGREYQIEGWRDWLNNQVVGEAENGKILSSSRIGRPLSKLSPDGNELSIWSVIPNGTRKQGEITDARITYKRNYRFHDSGIDVELELETDKPLVMKSLYESLPARAFETSYLDPQGKPLAEADGKMKNVKTVRILRDGNGTNIEFAQPVALSMDSIKAVSRQSSTVEGRALLIELPTNLQPGKPVKLNYTISPFKA